MNIIDKKIHNILDKYLFQIVVGFCILASALIRIHFLRNYLSIDAIYCLEPWMQFYEDNGIIGGLREGIGNYYIPYNVILAFLSKFPSIRMIILGLISCIFDYGIATVVYLILKQLKGDDYKNKAILVSLAVLYLPIVLMNGSLWKQCDSIYSFWILLALYFYIRDSKRLPFIMLGVAFIWKAQVIYVIPFFLLMYIVKKNYSILEFLWLPLIYIIAGLPAIMAGRSVLDVYSIYLKQTSDITEMSSGFPNIYKLGNINGMLYLFGIVAILLTMVVFAFSTIVTQKYRYNISEELYLYMAAWSIQTCCIFLPFVHDRYDYLAIILMFVYAIAFNHRLFASLGTMIVISALLYCKFLFGFEEIPMVYYALAYCICYLINTIELFRRVINCEKTI
ncbi:Mannosyltransferase related to Gpi18 [Butyrivibrio sp. Su6]|nr:Mannosyltransferase related to Gpi18 [Butyrivibrio sp. Su6]